MNISVRINPKNRLVRIQRRIPGRVRVGRYLPVQLGEELLELLGAVPAVERSDDLATRGVQRCEQGGGARADSRGCGARARRASSAGPAATGPGPGSANSRPHTRPGALWRIEVEAHHVVDLVAGERVGGQLERLDAVRFEAEGPPDLGHGRLRHPRALGHRPGRPVGGALLLRRRRISSATCSSVTVRSRPGGVRRPDRPSGGR